MEMGNEIFADGIGEISLSGGMVRLDLVSLTGSQNDPNNQPRFATKGRIVMPPEGFLRSFSAMENLVKQLVDAGLVRPREAVDGQTGTTGQARTPSGAPPKSPNF